MKNAQEEIINPEIDSETEPMDSWLAVGQIVGAHGLEGDVKIYPESDFSERFEQPGQRWLGESDGTQPRPMQLLKGRFISQKGLYVVSFAGVNSRSKAESLRGSVMLVQSCDRPTLAEGEYYLSDLIGLAVIHHQSRVHIGTVLSIANAGNDLLEVQLLAGQKVLIPFVTALVPLVDLNNRRIEIDPPKGLLPE